jgi:resuscitation-promoting factor RpfB
MKAICLLALSLLLLLLACQPASPSHITIIDGENIRTIESAERVPLLILTQAGVVITSNDRVLINGILVPLDQTQGGLDSVTLQIRHAVALTIVMPQGQQVINSAAWTVGEALSEAGIQLYASDFLDPPANTIITSPLTIDYQPSRELSVFASEQFTTIRSSAGTVGEALAGAGIPLVGLDYSSPSENEALPPDGQIRVVRVNEAVSLAFQPIPFKIETKQSAEIELGQQEILQPGINGLAMTRTRIRFEDGKEVRRVMEKESIMRPPQTKVVNAGTKLVSHGIENMQYWYSIQMYATSYSPCRSGISGCSYGTASGLRAGYGVVAMKYDWYLALQGMSVFIPGYGTAIVGDNNGNACAFSDCRPWIDLGYDDNNYQEWSGWVTVYFLGTPPAVIPSVLEPK